MEEKQKSRAKQYALFALYGTITVLLLIFILSLGDIGEILEAVRTANPIYIFASLGCVAVYMALYPLSLCILTRARGCKINASKTYTIAMTEHFFNGITPFSTGGQPFQVYAFAKSKVKPAESTCLLLMNFMVFMLVTNGFALCALFYFKSFVTTMSMTVIAIVGFTMNFTVLGITMLLATNKTVCRLLSRFLDFLCRFGWIAKFLKPRAESLKEYFVQVQDAFGHLIKKKRAFFLSVFTKILSMAAYYATTFFILRALHIDVPFSDMFFVICGTSFAVTMVVFLPTPGASGGIEFAFKSVFFSIAAGVAAVSYGGMLIWRMMTYYLVMLISLLFYIALEIGFSIERKRRAHEGANDEICDTEKPDAIDAEALGTENIKTDQE